ncbi:MAG: metallophosphoesterase [Myxococcota bacterium]
MRVLHTSDLHGKYKRLLSVDEPFDVWLDTGDFFDNLGRKPRTDYRIVAELESQAQAKWWAWKDLGRRLADWLDGRPAITVAGNHDFLRLGGVLRHDYAEVHEVATAGCEVLGLRWAGFREVTRDIGEWAGETDLPALEDLARATLECVPDVVATHARPAHVLQRDRMNHAGLPGFQGSSARWHFFGHEHATGGTVEAIGGTTYVNGACHVRIPDLEI